jgi:hypothetical protein
VILSTLLENIGSAPISGLEVLEPLRIVFHGPPSRNWSCTTWRSSRPR